MQGAVFVVCTSLLLSGAHGGFSWSRIGAELSRVGSSVGRAVEKAVHDVGAEANRFGDRVGAEANRFGDRIQPDIDNVREEFERVGDRVGAEANRFGDRIAGRSGDDGDGGQVLSIPDPEPGATQCSPIIEASLALSCDLAGESVNCSLPMAVGTVAHMKCGEAYVYLQYPGYKFVTCLPTFNWSDPIIKCAPDCGKLNHVGGTEFVASGVRAQVGEFSWHIGVYKLNKTDHFSHICGGSLLTKSLIISAAHCFWDNNRDVALPAEKFAVAAGKYHRDWYIDDEEVQERYFDDLFIHERFKGLKRNLAYDIAIIKVLDEFELTWAIKPICMDYPKAFEWEQLSSGNNGTIPGWGITENNTQSDVLMAVKLPFVDYLECGDRVAVAFQKFLTDDKICGGYINRNTGVCPGDSGGGYVFPHKTERGVRYYLRGIVSAGHVPPELWMKCDTQQLSAFTLVSKHRAFVERHVFDKRPRH